MQYAGNPESIMKARKAAIVEALKAKAGELGAMARVAERLGVNASTFGHFLNDDVFGTPETFARIYTVYGIEGANPMTFPVGHSRLEPWSVHTYSRWCQINGFSMPTMDTQVSEPSVQPASKLGSGVVTIDALVDMAIERLGDKLSTSISSLIIEQMRVLFARQKLDARPLQTSGQTSVPEGVNIKVLMQLLIAAFEPYWSESTSAERDVLAAECEDELTDLYLLVSTFMDSPPERELGIQRNLRGVKFYGKK